MTCNSLPRLTSAVLLLTCFLHPAQADPLEIPFDFSRGAIGLEITVKGTTLNALLDTGVDPSVIAMSRAEALGLPKNRGAGGEASGYGEGKAAPVYPATITGLSIGGRAFGPIEALAADIAATSAGYGRPIDAVLGYSFLKDKIVIIDYAARKIGILDGLNEVQPWTRTCRKHMAMTLQFLNDDNTPIIPEFRLGKASGPATLDTGSNGGIALFPRATTLPGVSSALVEDGEITHSGARGEAKSKSYTIKDPVGFGIFSLPPGQNVTMHSAQDEGDKRIANVGNRLFAAMKLKILLDYRGKKVTFFGDCGRPRQ